MRMSDTSTCGGSPLASSCAKASLAEAKLLNGVCSRARVFSSTQRIDLSSSTIQTGFIESSGIVIVIGLPGTKQIACHHFAYRPSPTFNGKRIVKQVCPGRLKHSIVP